MVSTKLVLINLFNLLLLASSGLCWIEHTSIAEGIHIFAGNVRCQNHSEILPQATLKIMEYDTHEDDELFTIKLYRGKLNPYRTWWKVNVKVDEEFDFTLLNNGAEVYYKFLHVCFEGQEVNVVPEINGSEDKEYVL